MLNLYFNILQIVVKNDTFGKSEKDEGFREQSKLTIYINCFLLSSVVVKLVFTKIAKISQYLQSLHSLVTQLWGAIFYLFELLVLANEITMW